MRKLKNISHSDNFPMISHLKWMNVLTFYGSDVTECCVFIFTPLGADILFMLFRRLPSVTLGFRSFQGNIFILSLPNLVWVFILYLNLKFSVYFAGHVGFGLYLTSSWCV